MILMKFIVEGVKSKPIQTFISETDLLTDEIKSIRRRQKKEITMIRVSKWQNLSEKKIKPLYEKAQLNFNNILAN